MRSIRGSLDNLQPLIPMSIGAFGADISMRETVGALIDTGATRTCIAQSLIEKLELVPRGKLIVSSATSYPERRRAYGYSIGFFCREANALGDTLYVVDHEFIAPPFQDNGNFSVLLSMDVLSRGRLRFEINGSFSFDFDF